MNPIERVRFAIARDIAISRHTNPRNFELVWYPFWAEVSRRLCDRANRFNLFVAPQYPLWRVLVSNKYSILEDSDNEVDSDDDAESDDEDEEMFDEANRSASTVAETIRDRDCKRITDFALLLWNECNGRPLLGELIPTTEDAIFPAAHSSMAPLLKYLEHIPVLIEVKRQPSRKLMGNVEVWRDKLQNFLLKAKEDVLIQVCLIFLRALICN